MLIAVAVIGVAFVVFVLWLVDTLKNLLRVRLNLPTVESQHLNPLRTHSRHNEARDLRQHCEARS